MLPRDRLIASLELARRRAGSAAEGSPEWEAALAGVDALEQELAAAEAAAPIGGNGEDRAVFIVGPVALRDGRTVQGTIAGRPGPAEALRSALIAAAGRVAGRQDYVDELERAAAERDFTIERALDGWGALTFYAWENAAP